MLELNYRQVHLDFHTSPFIPQVGVAFNAKNFAKTLQQAHVNSITCFARCHHGMLYYDSKYFPEYVHPHLSNKNMLKEMIEECHKLNIRVPIYITVQWDELTSANHPEWSAIDKEGRQIGNTPYKPGFYQVLCLNSGYRYFLKKITGEILSTLDVDGLFLDIVYPTECSCPSCLLSMEQLGIDTYNQKARMDFAKTMIDDFKLDFSEFIRSYKADVSIFYNTSHIGISQKKVMPAYSHFELETLPSGDWGYLHFPVTMRYARTLGLDCLGQTGKFHTEWGDFHSFKNPEALEYECFRMLALGAKCMIGDQMHPGGMLSQPVYERIGQVYKQVEEKEPWCIHGKPVVEIGVFTPEEFYGANRGSLPDSLMGLERMFDQLSFQFNIIDTGSTFFDYDLLILPDNIPVDEVFNNALDKYIKNGGKIIASFESGLTPDQLSYGFNGAGVRLKDHQTLTLDKEPARGILSPTNDYIDYILPNGSMAENLYNTEYVMYMKGLEVEADEDSTILCHHIDPYFDRTYKHFCSHRQTPSSGVQGNPAVIQHGNVIYFASPIFSIYNARSPKWCKTLMENAVNLLLPHRIIKHNGPSSLFIAVNEQKDDNRYVVHYLHYIPERRSQELDIIEDIIALYNIVSTLKVNHRVKLVQLVPECTPIDFQQVDDFITYTIPCIYGHQMVCVEYEDH